MGQFQASLRLPGETQSLSATVRLDQGRLQVASGEHLIGDWAIDSIDVSPIPEGIRVAAEGEVLLLDLPDRTVFEEEFAAFRAKRKRFGLGKAKGAAATPAGVATAVSVKTMRPKTPQPRTPKARRDSRLDRYLARARDRWGDKLPDWVFSRIGLAAAVLLIALCVIFAELVSNLLLIVGVVVLLIGGVTMLDNVLARRILHHKVSPIQVVIGGGTVFVVGLLIGFAA